MPRRHSLSPLPRFFRGAARESPDAPRVLILTPVKDAEKHLSLFFRQIERLTYPGASLSLGLLESDSEDNTYRDIQARLADLRRRYRRVGLWKRDFGYVVPPGMTRWDESIQIERRAALARSRNHLLFHALDDEAWVLWMDVDLVEYPADIIEQLLATKKDIVQPHCVLAPGGATFDWNAWTDHGTKRMDSMRGGEDLVPLTAVGGTMLLIRADVHREGLIFPTFLYGRENPLARPNRGEIETEGLGIMAQDMGYQCWGMPNLEIRHRNA